MRPMSSLWGEASSWCCGWIVGHVDGRLHMTNALWLPVQALLPRASCVALEKGEHQTLEKTKPNNGVMNFSALV